MADPVYSITPTSFDQPEAIPSKRIYRPKGTTPFTNVITSADASTAIPLTWPILVERLKKLQAKVYSSSIPSSNDHVLTIRIGDNLDVNGHIVAPAAGNSTVDTAICAESSITGWYLWRGSSDIKLTNSILTCVISQITPGTRLGKYAEIIVTPATEITAPETILTAITGWY